MSTRTIESFAGSEAFLRKRLIELDLLSNTPRWEWPCWMATCAICA